MIVLQDNEDRAIARAVRRRRIAAKTVTDERSMILLTSIIKALPSIGRMAGVRAAYAVRDLIRYAPRNEVVVEDGMTVVFPATTITTDAEEFPRGGIYIVSRRPGEECSIDLVDPEHFACAGHRICYLVPL